MKASQKSFRIGLFLFIICIAVYTLLRKHDEPKNKPVTVQESLNADTSQSEQGRFFKGVKFITDPISFRLNLTGKQKKYIESRLLQMDLELASSLKEYSGLKRRNVHRFPPENGNAWDYYLKALEMFNYEKMPQEEAEFITGLAKTPTGLTKTPEEAKKKQKENPQAYKQIMEKYKGAIELINKGAYQQWVDRGDKLEDGFLMLLPYLTDSIRANKFVSEYMNFLAQDKRYDEALKIFSDNLSMNQAIGQNGYLINGLIYIVNANIQLKALESLFNSADFTYDVLQDTARNLEIILINKISFINCLKVELVMSLAMAQKIINDPSYYLKTYKGHGVVEYQLYEPWWRRKVVIDWYDFQKKTLNDCKNLESLTYSDAMALTERWSQEVEKSENILVLLFYPAYGKAYSDFVLHKARIELAKVAIAAKMYQQTYNSLPGSLNDLMTTGLLNHVPLDPFTDQPLKMSLSPDQKTLKIYSVGQNMLDDAGDPGYDERGEFKDYIFTLTCP